MFSAKLNDEEQCELRDAVTAVLGRDSEPTGYWIPTVTHLSDRAAIEQFYTNLEMWSEDHPIRFADNQRCMRSLIYSLEHDGYQSVAIIDWWDETQILASYRPGAFVGIVNTGKAIMEALTEKIVALEEDIAAHAAVAELDTYTVILPPI